MFNERVVIFFLSGAFLLAALAILYKQKTHTEVSPRGLVVEITPVDAKQHETVSPTATEEKTVQANGEKKLKPSRQKAARKKRGADEGREK